MTNRRSTIADPRIWDADYCLTRALKATVAAFAAEARGNVVVDFGCGSMPYRPLFRHDGRYIGVDVVPGFADLVIQPGERVPLDAAAADDLISTQVLHKIEAFGEYLAECARLVRPGGRLLLTTHGTWTYHPASGGDYLRFTHDGLRRAIERAGFEVQTVTPLVGTLGTGMHLIQLVLNAWMRRLKLAPIAAAANVPTNAVIRLVDAITPAGTRLAAPVALAVVAARR